MLDGSALVSRKAVFADMLDTPIAELTMGNQVDAAQDLVDARALGISQ